MTTYDAALALEQKYFDDAWDQRERSRAALKAAPQSAAGSRAAVSKVKQAVDAQLAAMPGPEEAIAFGRIDLDEDGEVLYLGKQAIWSEKRDLLVIEWQRPAVEGFYKATVNDPLGVTRRRKFETERNVVLSFEETLFADLAQRVEALTEDERRGVDDALLRDLDAARDGEMRDIVQTIHESQYDLIRRPLDELLVIQGGPGTGKTAVALHRASWLLFNHREHVDVADVLVIGPSKTFGRYIEKVLPGLGNTGVAQADLPSLGPAASNGRHEDPRVAHLKGDARMTGLIGRALHQRVRFPERVRTLQFGSGARTVSFTRGEIEPQLDQYRSAGTYNAGRTGMRSWLTRAANAKLSGTLTMDAATIDAALERVWPPLTPAAFLQELLGSRQRISAAAGDDFTAGDVDRLHRPAADKLANETWSDSDVALLDEAEALINGRGRSYAHVIIDEAQDLSPMQLRSVRRRSSRGSYTIVGDLAQSTGPWARASWDDVIKALQQEYDATSVELRYGYRVPRQVTDLADQLLPHIAPNLEPATVIRRGPESPQLRQVDVDDVVEEAIDAARGHAANGLFVGVICADGLHDAVAEGLRTSKVTYTDAAKGQLGTTINLMTAAQSKGLEFDAVVVVEPAEIAGVDHSGLRHLYIALTRTTKFLTIVHSKQLELLGLTGSEPSELDLEELDEVTHSGGTVAVPSHTSSPPLGSSTGAARPLAPRGKGGLIRERTIRMTAEMLAEEVRATLDEDAYADLLTALADELQVSNDGWEGSGQLS